MSHTPSIMDYARFNYVAQPEDKIDPKLLIPGIGPYDKWAIHWAYAPIAGAKTPDDENKTLDTWAREQEKTPWLRFNTDRAQGADSGENTEAVGDADAVYSTGLGLKNLQRVMDNLLAATTHEGQDWDDLRTVYGRVVGQWANEMGHVTQIVGAFDSFEKHGGQDGVRFTLVPKARQVAAVKFLNENAFTTPTMLLRPGSLAAHRAGRCADPHPHGAVAGLEFAADHAAFRPSGGAGSHRRRSRIPPVGVSGRCPQGDFRRDLRALCEDRRLPPQSAARVSRPDVDAPEWRAARE